MSDVKFPSDEKTLIVQVFYQKGDEPFICGVNGMINDTTLDEIHEELVEYENIGIFDKGDGDYLFKAGYEPDQRGEYGIVEHAAYWQLDICGYRPVNHNEDNEK